MIFTCCSQVFKIIGRGKRGQCRKNVIEAGARIFYNLFC